MSLVAYENSDESDDEVEEKEENVSVPKSLAIVQNEPETEKGHITESLDNKNYAGTVHPKLVNTLPKPKNSDLPLVAEELTKRLLFSSVSLLKSRSSAPKSIIYNKKVEGTVTYDSSSNSSNSVRKPVKITLPSLSEFNEDEEAKPKKLKPSTKGSGLFSLLPAPKNLVVKETNRKLIPRVVSKDANVPKRVTTKKKTGIKESTSLINYIDSGEESGGEDTSEIDFFSLTAKDSENKTPYMVTSDSPSVETFLQHIPGPLSNTEPPPAFDGATASTSINISLQQETAEEVFGPLPAEASNTATETDGFPLDEDALQRLCGRRGRQEIAEMEIIDVCGETHLPDPKEWLTKQFTEEQETRSHSHRRRDGPTTQQRRKHQITYLAFQAKEHELELKNQWAQNKMSRKQTQAKYGF